MTTGLVLIAAILVLGGVIATVGDKIGMKIGKARLSILGLRPRQTATLITILTGVIISASTFGILFAIDDQLRTGVFELNEIQEELAEARDELNQAQRERQETEADLKRAVTEQRVAQRRLERINRSLKGAIAQQERTEAQLNTTRSQLNQVEANYQQAQTLLGSVSRQAAQLQSEILQLRNSRQQEIEEREQAIAQRDEVIRNRDVAIAQREILLKELEEQQAFLEQEVQSLEQEFQKLRSGTLALFRSQTLASGVVRIVDPNAAVAAVDQVLREANRIARQRIQPGSENAEDQVLQISAAQVEQVITEIRDGRDYVIRVTSAGNYVVGEPCVLEGESCIEVFVSTALNQLVFDAGEIVASTSVNPARLSNEELIDRINLLIAASQFQARQAGIVADAIQIADGRPETVALFFERLKEYGQPIDIQAVSANTTYTAGPVRLELIAVLPQDGQILFSTLTE